MVLSSRQRCVTIRDSGQAVASHDSLHDLQVQFLTKFVSTEFIRLASPRTVATVREALKGAID